MLDEHIPFLDAGPVVLVAHDIVNRLLQADLEPDLGGPDTITQHTGCWNVVLKTVNGWRAEQVDQRADFSARLE